VWYKQDVSEDTILLPSGGGERIENPLGGAITFKARGVQTDGALTVFEAVNPPGQGPPYHVHRALDELIYILEGALRLRLGDRVEEATAGAFVFIPRGMPHTWQAHGADGVRFLVVLAPAGLEQFFDRTAAAGGRQAEDAFDTFGGDDLEVLGPPLAESHPA
jgi:quercetin dioxygenase-like cupin family protein